MSDKELEDYLAGKSGLPDAYASLPKIQPPDHLDAAILAEAHRTVNSGPGDARARKPRWRAWAVPLSAVATLFVVVMVGMETPYTAHETIPQSIPAPAPAPAAEKPHTVPSAERIQVDKNSEANESKRSLRVLKQSTIRADALKNESRATGEAQDRAAQQQIAKPAQPAPMPAETMAQPDVQAKSLQDERAPEVRTNQPAPQGLPAPAAPVAAAPPAAEQAPAPAAAAVAAPTTAAEAPVLTTNGFVSLNPRQWLMHIIKLKRQGRLAEAKKQLAEFRKRYPGYRVPKEAEVK